ncbi:MAG: hypothetical protein M1832_004409 [Thelocarpon impressellum]|nr:MAG: hypothetical protein M1832_004409 [Thelocarpon impressellum]
MAQFSRNQKADSSNPGHRDAAMRKAHLNVLASCYAIEAGAAVLKGFHYSTTGDGGVGPPLAAGGNGQRLPGEREGAAHTIPGECERLFCETMRLVFLGEGRAAGKGSLGVGARIRKGGGPAEGTRQGTVEAWIEVWDYVGDACFRAFLAGGVEGRALVVFFDEAMVGNDLKNGLMALIELASVPSFDCDSVVLCLDRGTEADRLQQLTRDLGWVGFGLSTLDPWGQGKDYLSERWLFLKMDV